MLPSIKTQQRLQLNTARGQIANPPPGTQRLVAVVLPRGPFVANGVHVRGLHPPVGARVRRASEIGGQQAVVAGAGLDEPQEARAEHGRGGGDELAAQGVDGGEGGLELAAQVLGHGRAGGGDALEEEVVVVGHGGVVEDGGLVGFAGGHEEDGFHVAVFEIGAWK